MASEYTLVRGMQKLSFFLAICFASMIFQACSSKETPQSRTNTAEKTLVGHYVYGHEVNSFQRCGQDEVFWVTGSGEILELLASQYSDHAAKPYDEVFVKIAGDFTNKDSAGFAADYDGQVQVSKVFLMTKKSITDCKSEE